MRVLGAILAGGRSERFGTDKALALLSDRRLMDLVANALAPQVAAIVTIGHDLPAGGTEAISDRPAPGLGPLGGVNAALHHARAGGYDSVVTVGCDMPILPPDLVERLSAAGETSFVEAVPIVGLWPVKLAEKLDAWLAGDNRRSMRAWAEVVGAARVALPEDLPNINTLADLAALTRTFAKS